MEQMLLPILMFAGLGGLMYFSRCTIRWFLVLG